MNFSRSRKNMITDLSLMTAQNGRPVHSARRRRADRECVRQHPSAVAAPCGDPGPNGKQPPSSVPLPSANRYPAEGGLDSLALYLREIAPISLLTREEEAALARRVRRGDPRARERMITANLRLVVKIARAYEHYGLPLADLVSEGNIGLMEAVNRYDPRKGAKLSVYASYWIRQAIRRALEKKSRMVRLSTYAQEQLTQIRDAAVLLTERMGREPTDEELSESVEMPARRVRDLRQSERRPLSLDALLEEGGADSFGEKVPDENAPTPLETVSKKDVLRLLGRLMENLTAREQVVLRQRFGLNGEAEMSLEALAQQWGLTRERVRQIQNAALLKLRRRVEASERPFYRVHTATSSTNSAGGELAHLPPHPPHDD
jgi:RNA polymerase primary sigma factor